MDANAKRERVKRYYDEIWSQGRVERIDEWMADGYENHDPATPGVVLRGRDALKGLVATYRQAFPDLKMPIIAQYVDGDVVVSRWVASGTQHGSLMGIAPTHRSADGVEGTTFTHFQGDRIVRDIAVWDALGLVRKLGGEIAPPRAEGMSLGDTKALVQRSIDELWNGQKLDAVDALFGETYVGHFAVLPAPLAGREALKQFARGYFGAFPDIRFTVEDLAADGDRVVARWTARGTHRGPLMGHAASNKSVTVTGIWIHRIAGGRIAEQWGVNDTLGMMRQIGAL